MKLKAILIALLAGGVAAVAQPAKNLAAMEPALEKIAAYELGQSRAPIAEFDQFLRDSLASKAQLGDIEQRLIKLLQSNATLAGKDYACRQLSMLGTTASIPVLSPMLLKPETVEMARYALTRIQVPEVDKVLRDAVGKTTGKARIGMINSLGQRRDAKVVAILKPLLSSNEAATAEAAAVALGEIGGTESLQALAAARSKVPEAARFRVSEAYLHCAAKAPASAALRAAKELSAANEPVMIRIAALSLLTSVSSKDAVPVLVNELNSRDAKMQAAAVRLLTGIKGPEAAQALQKAFPKSSAAGKVRLLMALADRNDSSAAALVSGAATSDQPEVRAAALFALGAIGDPSAVNVLAEAAATREGAEQSTARESLYRLRGAGTDAAITAGIATADPKIRVELIRAAGERGIAASAGALLKSARDSDPDVRRESLRALRDTADPSHEAALLEVMLSADNAATRREAGRTLASVVKKGNPPSVARVTAAYQSIASPQIKASLIEVLGQVATEDALPPIRAALSETDRDISRAAILALSEWPTPAPMPDLLIVAKSAAIQSNQVLALRGYIKLAAIPGARPNAESARLLGDALALAKQPDEKKAVLAVLPTYPSKEALQLAEASLNDEAVAKEAKLAFDRITRAMKVQR